MLDLSTYQTTDVVSLAKELLGKRLLTHFNGIVTGGTIVETEAYKGAEDKACHAYNNRRTKRTEPLFAEGGISYVYLCYGMHALFNVVTAPRDVPHAILIRALEPTHGIETMLQRRNKKKLERSLTAGPGALCQALAITTAHSGISLRGPEIWIENADFPPFDILSSPRIGVSYAGQDALLPYRFRTK